MRKTVLSMAMAMAAMLGACGGGGGGGSEPSKLLTFGLWGDSLSAGYTLERKPADTLRAAGLIVLDHSANAATVREALGIPNMYFDDPARRLDPFPGAENVVVLAFEVADAAGRGETPEAFKENLLKLLDRTLGLRVAFVSFGRYPAYAAVVREVAATRGGQVIDLSGIPTILPDGIHGDQATSDLWWMEVAAKLKELK